MAGALEGIRVIDFGQYIAGPLAGMLLADQGADVIKVDPPGGPHWQTPANATWNRGKRSLLLDLKQPEDLATARSLVQGADVVVENFRPGVMARLGLGAEAMTHANPRLVYSSLPGFASDDPRAAMPAYEGVVGAATATYRPSGDQGERPCYTAIPIASTYAAFQAVVAIVMGLNAREHSGVGQCIEIPLFDSMFQSIGRFGVTVHHALPSVPKLGLTFRTPSEGDPRIFPWAFFARTAPPSSGMLALPERRYTKSLHPGRVLWVSCYRPSKCTKSNICPL